MTRHERLKDEFQERALSVRRFATILDNRFPGLRGTSRPTVDKILKGHSTPSLEWVQAAASIFGVMPRWLWEGMGPRRPEDTRLHRESVENFTGRPSPTKTFEEFNLRVHTAFEGLEDLPYNAFAQIAGYLGVLYRQKGPEAFGAEASANWRWPESGDELDGEPGVNIDQIHDYIWQEFGRVLRWSGTGDAERIAATLAIISSLYLTEFAGRF